MVFVDSKYKSFYNQLWLDFVFYISKMYFVIFDKMDRIMAQKLYAFWFLVTLMKDGVRKSEFSIVC